MRSFEIYKSDPKYHNQQLILIGFTEHEAAIYERGSEEMWHYPFHPTVTQLLTDIFVEEENT